MGHHVLIHFPPEDGVDIGPCGGDAREEDVEVVWLPEGGVGELPELDESAEAGGEREGQQRELGPREDPEHLLRELGSVLK